MGCGASAPAPPANVPRTLAAASVLVSAGEHTQHCCWAVCAKLDVFQPKYGNVPLVYTVQPGTGPLCYEKYGVGTKFTSRNAMGEPEVVTISQLTYPTQVRSPGPGNPAPQPGTTRHPPGTYAGHLRHWQRLRHDGWLRNMYL